MNYRETETDNFTVSNNGNTSFGFSLFGTTYFLLYFMNSQLNVVDLSESTATTLTLDAIEPLLSLQAFCSVT